MSQPKETRIIEDLFEILEPPKGKFGFLKRFLILCRRNDRNDKQRRRPKSQSAPTSRGQSDFGDGDFDRRISFSRDKSRNRDREQRDYRDRDHRDREHGDRNNQVKKQSGSKLEQYRNRTKTEQKSETEQRSDQETNNLDLNRTGSNRNNPNNQRRKNNRGKSRGRHPDDNTDDNFRREVIVANHKDDRIGKWRLTAVSYAVRL